MNTQLTSSPQTVLAELRSAVRGTVIAPTDDRYDETRRLFPGDVDLRPSVIVRVVDAADVAGVIGVARRTGLELAVRSGGHNTAGHGSTDGGIVIDLRDMKAIDIDVAGRTAWVETGAT
ncbi:MAG TPA: FAD-binding protein, partial [Candidatus Limnocylindrales bacterium]|nr:FAD-binding protein [Candidatus Limnocylindrales bacterium]